jgi:hypothetical protein
MAISFAVERRLHALRRSEALAHLRRQLPGNLDRSGAPPQSVISKSLENEKEGNDEMVKRSQTHVRRGGSSGIDRGSQRHVGAANDASPHATAG